MTMLLWCVYFILSMIFTVICYMTNPIVLLFCNEDGELPSFLHNWQTWDNSCNPSDIVDICPSWLQFDWVAHYTEYKGSTPYLLSVNRERWFTKCYNDDFTLLERLKRYLCRLMWLTRNNSYGFCFYLLGRTVTPGIEVVSESENTKFIQEKNGPAFRYKNTAPIFTVFGWTVHWNNLLGWKIDEDAQLDTRAMIANRVAFYFEKE